MSVRPPEYTHELGILMPAISDWHRTEVRYGGLVSELTELGVEPIILESHASYQGDGVFAGGRKVSDARLGAMHTELVDEQFVPRVVRDLTMPKTASMPLYEGTRAPLLVHPPEVNDFFRSKSSVYELMPHVQPFTIPRVDAKDVHEAMAEVPGQNIVVKPDTGMASNGVLIGKKADVAAEFAASNEQGLFVVQEAIDTSKGLPEYGVHGAHNLRMIVIGGTAIFGFIRDDGGASLNLSQESELFTNREFLHPDDYSHGFRTALSGAQIALEELPGSQQTVLAIDLMRGVNAAGDEREYVVEINRRPLRNSPFDGDDEGTLWASQEWDKAEAEMLLGILKDLHE